MRYVDDFVIFADSKAELIAQRGAVVAFLERLRLRIHAWSSSAAADFTANAVSGLPLLADASISDQGEHPAVSTTVAAYCNGANAAKELDWPAVRAHLASWERPCGDGQQPCLALALARQSFLSTGSG